MAKPQATHGAQPVVTTVRDAAEKVLATQGSQLDAAAITALGALVTACDATQSAWELGHIQQIGKPGVAREIFVSDIAYELSLNKSLSLSSLDASGFIEDVLYNAREEGVK